MASGATLGGYGSVTGAVTNNGTLAVANAVPAFAAGPARNVHHKRVLVEPGHRKSRVPFGDRQCSEGERQLRKRRRHGRAEHAPERRRAAFQPIHRPFAGQRQRRRHNKHSGERQRLGRGHQHERRRPSQPAGHLDHPGGRRIVTFRVPARERVCDGRNRVHLQAIRVRPRIAVRPGRPDPEPGWRRRREQLGLPP